MEPAPHYLEIAGDPLTRGRTHGGELKQQVKACVDFYRELFGYGEAELAQRASVFEELIDNYAPALAEEIRGIAGGSGLPTSHIFAINARSELVPFAAAECTALAFPDDGLLGQTWDWCDQLEPLVTVLRITREDGHTMLTVTEPGIVGKIGLSSAGVGVCLNFLSAPRPVDAIPVHILLREIMEADSLDAACRRLRAAGVGPVGNILLGSAAGQAINFEFSGDEAAETPLEGNWCHTNHCLERVLSAGEMEQNSRSRLERAQSLLGAAGQNGLGGLRTVLSDQQSAEAPICAPYQPLMGLNVGTICTVVLDLRRRELQLRMGADPAATFEHHALHV